MNAQDLAPGQTVYVSFDEMDSGWYFDDAKYASAHLKVTGVEQVDEDSVIVFGRITATGTSVDIHTVKDDRVEIWS